MILFVVFGFVAQSYVFDNNYDQSNKDEESQIASAATYTSEEVVSGSVDKIAAVNLAAGLANSANLPVAVNVANLSTSVIIEESTNAKVEPVISKPDIINLDSSIVQGTKTYKVQEGDTIDSIAAANGISTQTIRWANNMTSDTLTVGNNLKILPVDGIVYTIKQNDEIDKLVEKYKANKQRVLTFNNLELDGIKVGTEIIIPGGELPTTERPGYVAPVVRTTTTTPSVGYVPASYAVYSGNRYAYGWCTWYAYNRFAEMNGRTIGSLWGNANTWDNAAAAAGFSVSYGSPTVGAIFQTDAGWAGHVGVVESINYAPDGSIISIGISDMNGSAGWGRVGYETWSPAKFRSYKFIF